jgi:hypothetical protein
MNRSRLRAFVSFLAVICLGAGLSIIIRSTKLGQSLNDDPKALSRLPVRQMKYWDANFRKPLSERITAPPEEILHYLRADNLKQGFSEVPTAATDPSFVDPIKKAIRSLPTKIQRRLEKKLAAVFIVENLGGSAISNTIFADGPDTPEIAGFLALDAKVLWRPANAWASWKDQSPFKDGDLKIATHIAEPDDDNLHSALQFILLHEIAHILAIGEEVHPSWDAASVSEISEFPFTALSWEVKKGSFVRKTEYENFKLPDVHYYSADESKLNNSEILKAYIGLEHSPFVTLYASTNPFDDFADTFATYVHSQILHKPYEVRIYEGEKLKKTFKLCYGQRRCKAKEQMVRDFYKRL